MSQVLLNRKLKYWESQLLDLSKRNRMINYRETIRSTMRVIEPGFEELFSRLITEEEELTFQRAVDKDTDIRLHAVLSLMENLAVPIPVSIGDIKTDNSIIERQKTLRNLRSKAKLSLEEQGTNILYMSFGFLEWKDKKGATAKWLKSPLVIVPVSLTIDSINSPYTLSKYEDDVVVNPTLSHYLETDFGLTLPAFDENEQTLEAYFSSLEPLVDQRGWRINREVSLGLLSFLKISMYKDLKTNKDRIKNNPVIRAIAGFSDMDEEFLTKLDRYDLDSVVPTETFHVLSADSSQRDAINYSRNNVSFVMQGPPGTGKSQTITNMIAQALADGKRVLFVSEKMAALQVVYRRLEEADLADFCLPLHSHKASKRAILELIGKSLSLDPVTVRDSELTRLSELSMERKALNRYANALHQPLPSLGLSCYEVYGKLLEVSDANDVLFTVDQALELSLSSLTACTHQLDLYSDAVRKINYQVKNNPWSGLKMVSFSQKLQNDMDKQLGIAIPLLEQISLICEDLKHRYGIEAKTTWNSLSDTNERLRRFAEATVVPSSWILGDDLEAMAQLTESIPRLQSQIQQLREEIGYIFHLSVFDFDSESWIEQLNVISGLMSETSPKHNLKWDQIAARTQEAGGNFAIVADNLTRYMQSIKEINGLLGTGFSDQEDVTGIIDEICNLLERKLPIFPEWPSNRQSLQDWLSKAKDWHAEVVEIENKLLADWEKDVLQLEYQPILNRYKTDYTSALRIFKSQYRKDKKTVALLRKAVNQKKTDQEIIQMLGFLKKLSETKEWFVRNANQLTDCYGQHFTGVATDWNRIENALSVLDRYQEIFEGNVPTAFIDKVGQHMDETTLVELKKLSNLAKEHLRVAFITAKAEEWDLVIGDVPFSTLLENAETQAALHVKFQSVYKEIIPHLQSISSHPNTLYPAIENLHLARKAQSEHAELSMKASKSFRDYYQSDSTDWPGLRGLLAQARAIQLDNFPEEFIHQSNNVDAKAHILIISADAENFRQKCTPAVAWLLNMFELESSLEEQPLTSLLDKLKACQHNVDTLDAWLDFCELRNEVMRLPISSYITAIEESDTYSTVTASFLKGFYKQWLSEAETQLSEIRKFKRDNQDKRIDNFTHLDQRQLSIAKARIRERVISKYPKRNRLLRANDEESILKRELQKQRNIMPLRKLFKSIPNLLQTLKPCFMMSPLSVSYFLESEAYQFDMVIFDEASQIFPEDAIGAVYRGSQVIIAGDSKQLPPTNFFAASTRHGEFDTDDESEYVEDLASSILEETAITLPNRSLLWHYRSKHEHLIAFSNRQIYKNGLITFPSPSTSEPDTGVEYVYVPNGYYEGGGKNCNIAEANKCVMLVLQHIQKHPERSLGIIAFSEKQQAVIENTIMQFREKHPHYEEFFDENKDEPFFVKNLENVQGDERDTIFFSICYAKDRNGRMYMRFGPLGHQGGERRLNVAITRAKQNVKLIGSIQPSDIDLSRTDAEGVHMLRSYIEFAQNGERVLPAAGTTINREANDTFCSHVADYLRTNGYAIKTNVGCSDYKVDMVVEEPDAPGEVIAAIECDGLSYAQARTARDRDHLRHSVLKGMGWKVYRVWSTEWIRNPIRESQALLSFLKACQVKKTVEPECNEMVAGNGTASFAEAAPSVNDLVEFVKSEKQDKTTSDNPYEFQYYVEAKWWEAPSSSYSSRFSDAILYILSVEQPLHQDILCRRVSPLLGLEKATKRVRAEVEQAIRKIGVQRVRVDSEGFVYTIPKTKPVVRIPRKHDTPRPIEYIHTEEIAEAMRIIVGASFGILVDDLQTECNSVFGFDRKGPKIKEKLDAAVDFLIKSKIMRIIDDKCQLIGD